MSGESGRRSSRAGSGGSTGGNVVGAGAGGVVVRPHSANDSKTVMESFVHFLHDVVGTETTSPSSPKQDGDGILWARFDDSDLNDAGPNPELHVGAAGAASSAPAPPLLLVLGYANGAQVWSIGAGGEAAELLSLRDGPVKALKIIPQPEPESLEPFSTDRFAARRPLVALCEAVSSASQSSNVVKFVSLRTGEDVHSVAYKQPVSDILANRNVVVVTFHEKMVVLDSYSLKHRFWIGSCFPCSGPNANPVALSSRWLAYADNRIVSHHQSCGGVTGDAGQSYAATVISAAKSLTKGLSALGETVASSLSGGASPTAPHRLSPHRDGTPGAARTTAEAGGVVSGVVSVVDVARVDGDKFGVTPDAGALEALVAHFPAHAHEPVSALAWDRPGRLLFSADRLGHCFNVFKIMSHPWNSSFAAVHHLYALHRGDTTAKVQDVAFSLDSRWVAVSTYRGTTHVFPITPYGGPVSVRTHLCQKVVNRSSRFHKSAGIDEIDAAPAHGSPGSVLSGSPQTPSHLSPEHPHHPASSPHHTALGLHGNPRLTPPPAPTVVHSVAHVKQPLTLANAIPGSGGTNPSAGFGRAHSLDNVDAALAAAATSVCVAGVFGASRGWLGPHPSLGQNEPRMVDALFVVGWHGGLLEYILEPHPAGQPPPSPPFGAISPPTTAPPRSLDAGGLKIADDVRIELASTPRARWMLRRLPTSSELRPPLASESPLLRAQEAVGVWMNGRDHRRTPMWTGGVELKSPGDEFLGLRGPEEIQSGSGRGSSDAEIELDDDDDDDEEWLAQVEMITYAGPHRRLWMGPQFSFKVVNPNTTTLTPSSSALFADAGYAATVATLDGDQPRGAAPAHASAGRFDSLADSINLESLNLSDPRVRSDPVDMPATGKGRRRPRTSSGLSNPSDSRQRHISGDESIAGGVVEVYGSWPDSARPELTFGGGVETIGEEGAPPAGEEALLKESLADAMLDAALAGEARGGFGRAVPPSSSDSSEAARGSGDSSQDASGEFVVASEEIVDDDEAQETLADEAKSSSTPPPPTLESFSSSSKRKGKKKKK